MYKLTTKMERRLEGDLHAFHKLFHENRCRGLELEELVANALKMDKSAEVRWDTKGHDKKADIVVLRKGEKHFIQVKSGQFNAQGDLVLSGPRLGRFGGDLVELTKFLNDAAANVLAIPYVKREREGVLISHDYRICYVAVEHLDSLRAKDWKPSGGSYLQINKHKVELRLQKSMSWQVWWKIPAALLSRGRTMSIS